MMRATLGLNAYVAEFQRKAKMSNQKQRIKIEITYASSWRKLTVQKILKQIVNDDPEIKKISVKEVKKWHE